MSLLEHKSKRNEYDIITGISQINHRIRRKIGLTCDEYCMAFLINEYNIKKEVITYEVTFRKCGFDQEETKTILKSLKEKQIIAKGEKDFLVTDVWHKEFVIELDEFEQFWKYNGKILWTGSKVEAQRRFKEVRKTQPLAYILNQRNGYFKLLELEGEWRTVMGAAVFLNPKTERFKEDFWEQVRRKQGKSIPIEQAPKPNRETVNDLF